MLILDEMCLVPSWIAMMCGWTILDIISISWWIRLKSSGSLILLFGTVFIATWKMKLYSVTDLMHVQVSCSLHFSGPIMIIPWCLILLMICQIMTWTRKTSTALIYWSIHILIDWNGYKFGDVHRCVSLNITSGGTHHHWHDSYNCEKIWAERHHLLEQSTETLKMTILRLTKITFQSFSGATLSLLCCPSKKQRKGTNREPKPYSQVTHQMNASAQWH